MMKSNVKLFFVGFIIGMVLYSVTTLILKKDGPTQIDVANIPSESITEPYRGFNMYEKRVSECLKDRECFYLAKAVYFEARGEPIEGQIAVANVILKRVSSVYYPNTVEEVVKYKRRGVCHFSYRCNSALSKGIRDIRSFEKSVDIASQALYIGVPDLTGGADHFLNKRLLKRLPRWAKVYEHTVDIGNHSFYRRSL